MHSVSQVASTYYTTPVGNITPAHPRAMWHLSRESFNQYEGDDLINCRLYSASVNVCQVESGQQDGS